MEAVGFHRVYFRHRAQCGHHGLWIGNGHQEADERRCFKDGSEDPIDPNLYSGALPSSLIPALDDYPPSSSIPMRGVEVLSHHAYWSLHSRLATFAPNLSPGVSRRAPFSSLTPSVPGGRSGYTKA
jgi:hypothetical protein